MRVLVAFLSDTGCFFSQGMMVFRIKDKMLKKNLYV